MRRISILLAAVLVSSCVLEDPVDKAQKAITYENIEKHIAELSSDKYKGRKPMSETEGITVEYLEKQMKEIGLEPGNKGSYIQEVPLMSVVSEISPELLFKKGDREMRLKKFSEYITFTRKTEEEMNLEGSEVVFVGYGIVAPEYGRNDFSDIDVKGKTVLMFVNDPGYGEETDYFKGNAMTYYGRWTYKFEEAARQGAKACIIIHENGPAGYPWSVVRNNAETAKQYLQSEDGYKNRCMLEGWVTKDAAEKLLGFLGHSIDALKEKSKSFDFKPFELGATMSGWIKSKFSYGKSKNVMGLIKGSETPEEVVVYTAHWDHLGVARPIDGDSIYNGATDNASAVSWMLEIARGFKALGKSPKRSLLFLSVTAEEQGLLGSEYYAQHPVFPMKKTVAVLNTDVILFLGKFRDVTLTGHGLSDLDEWVGRAAKEAGRYIAPDPNPDNGMYFRSDQLPFVKRGVPAIFAKGYIDAEKYGKEKTLELVNKYWKETYHKPFDEYDPEKHDLSGLVEDARLMFKVGHDLSQSSEWPGWKEGAGFKRQ